MQLSIEEAEQEFIKLLDRIEPRKVAGFLDWIVDSFAVVDSAQPGRKSHASMVSNDVPLWMNAEVAQADAVLRKIALEMRSELPVTAVLDTEVQYWPTSGLDSDCNPETTVHVDSFLYEEDDIDDLVDEGRLHRNYCTKCGSREVKPLTFISHSLSVDQLRYMFTALVPLTEAMSDRLIVDVGSRLGAVLYASYLYGGGRVNAVGIEINKEFCVLQGKTIEDNGMDHRIKVINDDVRNQGQLLASADVVVLNNVFCFFLPPQEQVSCWNSLYANIRGGAVIISNPTLEAVTEHLELPFSLSDWVTKLLSLCEMKINWQISTNAFICQCINLAIVASIDTTHLAARFSGTSDELFEDCEKLTLYSVLHRTSG